MKRPLAYLTAAWSGEPDVDMELAAHYCRLAYEAGFSPICPLLYLPLFLNDSVPEEHKAGIDMRRDMLRRSHTADELLAGTDTANTESKTAQAQMLILELLADGKRMPSAELEKAVNERGISSRTMRTAKSRIGDRLVTEKDGTAWVCYLRD